jgi:uncharacterized damage-inducible protein DinB
MNNTYIKQFEFELWSNTMILKSLQQLSEPVARASLLFSHLINSHCMWICRLKTEPLTVQLFEERSLADNEKLLQENHSRWTDYLKNITQEELDRIIFFEGAWDGSKRSMRIEDVLIHLINHSSYHRGQIVQLLKGKLAELPLSTYIIFASELE